MACSISAAIIRSVVNGRNPIVAHEYLGESVEGKDVFVADDIISSGESMLDIAFALKKQGARRIFANATYAIFTNGLAAFDEAVEQGVLNGRVRHEPYLPHAGAEEPRLVPRGGCFEVYCLLHCRSEPRHFRQRHH